MNVKFKKWGNSIGMIVPKLIVQKYNIDIEKEYKLIEESGGFIIKEIPKSPSLDELLEGMSRTKRHGEQIDNYVGKERFWNEEN